MQFKSLDDKYGWQTKGNKELRCLADIMDKWTQMLFNEEIVITSALRPKGTKPSYHPLGQAVDFRTKGLPGYIVTSWIDMIRTANKNLKNFTQIKGRFTFLHEDIGGNNEHFHLQFKQNEPI